MKRKNILIVVLDGCRADRIGVYGYRKRDTTPVIDSLARSGFVCKNNYATSFCTMPSIVSALTGQYPAKHKATATWGYADNNFPFLTEIMNSSGYDTFGVSNNIKAMSPEMGFVRGYDRYYRVGRSINWFKESKEEQRGARTPTPSIRLKRRLLDYMKRFSQPMSEKVIKATQLSWYADHDMGGQRAVEVFFEGLDAATPGKPFFAYLNLPDTHHPFITIEKFSKIFGLPNITDNLLKLILQCNEFEEEGRDLSEDEFETLQQLYDCCVRYSDHLFGRIVDGLNERGIFKDTVVAIIGDHGGNTWEKKRFYGSTCFTYEAEIKVPLILLNSSLTGETNKLTSLVDLFPTLLNIAKVPQENQPISSGISLFDVNRGHPYILVDYPAYPEWLKMAMRNYPTALVKYGLTNRTMVTSEGQKFIWVSSGNHERYDLNQDPAESNNLYNGSIKDFEFINELKKAYCKQVGFSGSSLEVYPHNDIGPNFSLLPLLQQINPNSDRQKIIHV
jgi:arylsulfatase A-like enzyme